MHLIHRSCSKVVRAAVWKNLTFFIEVQRVVGKDKMRAAEHTMQATLRNLKGRINHKNPLRLSMVALECSIPPSTDLEQGDLASNYSSNMDLIFGVILRSHGVVETIQWQNTVYASLEEVLRNIIDHFILLLPVQQG